MIHQDTGFTTIAYLRRIRLLDAIGLREATGGRDSAGTLEAIGAQNGAAHHDTDTDADRGRDALRLRPRTISPRCRGSELFPADTLSS